MRCRRWSDRLLRFLVSNCCFLQQLQIVICCCSCCCCFTLDSVIDVCRRKNMTSKKNSSTLQTAAISASPELKQHSHGVGRQRCRTAERGAAAYDVDLDDKSDLEDEIALDDDVFNKCETWLRDVATANNNNNNNSQICAARDSQRF